MSRTVTVLLTGFEPFNNETINPAWEAVRTLDGWQGEGFVVAALQLPCVFGRSNDVLAEAIGRLRPALIIAVGQAGGRSELAFERVAVNLNDAPIPDNASVQPIDEMIEADGPAAYFSTLPVKAIVHALRAAGLPAALSYSAGTFVCNHVFYGLMHRLACDPAQAGVRAGFVHIPFLPLQAAAHPGKASMALSDVAAGLRIAVTTALAAPSAQPHHIQDGGRLH